MYIDQSPAHYRFAAYEMSDDDVQTYLSGAQQLQRDQLSQQRDIAMAEIGQRASASRQSAAASTRNAQISAGATLAAAKLQHQALMARLHELEIPQMEIDRIDKEGKLKILQAAQTTNEQTLAADVVKTAASMGGPGDWVQAANYARGISQTQIPQYLKLLSTGGDTSQLGAGAGVPTVQSYEGLINSLSGGDASSASGGPAGSGGGRDWASINSMADSLILNPGKVALGGLEGLTSDELSGLGSIIKARGGSTTGFLDAYKRTRFGMDNASASAAA